MPEDTDDLGLDAETVEEIEDASTLTVDEWRKREAKLKEEAHKLRAQLRRTEMSKEYGDEVLEFVPSSLPLQEQKELAAKLSQRLGVGTKTQDVQAPAQGPEVVIEQPNIIEVPVPEAGPTPEERNIAAVAQGSSPQAASTAQTPLSTQEATNLAVSDQTAYQRLKAAGLVKPETLEGAFG